MTACARSPRRRRHRRRRRSWLAHNYPRKHKDGSGSQYTGDSAKFYDDDEYTTEEVKAQWFDGQSEEKVEQGMTAAQKQWGSGGRRARIKMLLKGDDNCRRSRGLTESGFVKKAAGKTQPTPASADEQEWSAWGHFHRTGASAEAEDSSGTYDDKCPTAQGNRPPKVANLTKADVVEDAIELYILDITLNQRLNAEEAGEANQETESRALRVERTHPDHTPNHGHFRKWRKAIEKRVQGSNDWGTKRAFWVPEMKGGDCNKDTWNRGLRQSISFPVGANDKESPTMVRINRMATREVTARTNSAKLKKVRDDPNAADAEGELTESAGTEIRMIEQVMKRNRTV